MNVEILSILDTSGSMAGLATASRNGYNEFIQEQKTLPGLARVSLAFFDSAVRPQYVARYITEVSPLLSYPSSGMTAMYDAIGQTMDREGARIAREGWADKVIVCILTDGEENNSREYSAARIKQMIEHAQSANWHFVFLAANQDAFMAGGKIGIAAQHTYSFNASAAGTQAAYASISNATRSIRGTTF